MDEAGLLEPRDDAHTQAELIEDPLDELAAVSGLAHRAGRHRADTGDPVPRRDALERLEGAETAVHGRFLETARRQALLAQPHHLFGAVEHDEVPIGTGLRHDHVDRVASDVDGRDAHHGRRIVSLREQNERQR